jgi:riboflavin kinase/FMN adenylyltransferase
VVSNNRISIERLPEGSVCGDAAIDVHSLHGRKRAATGEGIHLAVGMFDGVHLGHQAVVGSALAAAADSGGEAAVLTFDPHPSRILRPEHATQLLFDLPTRVEVLLRLGISAVYVQHFTAAFARREAAEFLPFLKSCLPQLCSVHVGENFRFGRQRKGDAELLINWGLRDSIKVVALPRREEAGDVISSSRIRCCVESGEMEIAAQLLGRPYCAAGTVKEGKRMGRELGFPTLNLSWNPEALPALGVYFARVHHPDGGGGGFDAVANFGLRPTVENTDEPLLEVHLLDPPQLVPGPGDFLEVELLGFLRSEERFPSVTALRSQVEKDLKRAREYFN